MIGRVKTYNPVRRQPKPPRQPYITMARSAGIADVTGIYGRRLVAGLQNCVFAMTIGTNRRLHHPAGDCLAVHTVVILLGNINMASAAQVRYAHAELCRFGALYLVGFAMAGGAIRRCFITLAQGLGMPTLSVVTGHLSVTAGAIWLGHTFRMRILFMFEMAALAGDRRMDVPFELISYFAVTA
jgi:hypothetical protein